MTRRVNIGASAGIVTRKPGQVPQGNLGSLPRFCYCRDVQWAFSIKEQQK
jgi:hypothetical protein